MEVVDEDGVELYGRPVSHRRLKSHGIGRSNLIARPTWAGLCRAWRKEKSGSKGEVDEDTYANVTVHHQADSEQTVNDGVVGAARNERGDGKGDETSGENALKCPMV